MPLLRRLLGTMPHTPGGIDVGEVNRLTRMRSINRLDITSPLLTPGGQIQSSGGDWNIPLLSHGHSVIQESSPGPPTGGDGGLLEENLLYTVKTSVSLPSRLFSVVPESTLFSLRNYYNDFTTIDWANAFVRTNKWNYKLEHPKTVCDSDDSNGTPDGLDKNNNYYNNKSIKKYNNTTTNRMLLMYSTYVQFSKWILIVLIGLVFACIAFTIDKFELLLVGFKYGYCQRNWLLTQVACCNTVTSKKTTADTCKQWITWASIFKEDDSEFQIKMDYVIYVLLTIILAYIACQISLTTKMQRKPRTFEHLVVSESSDPIADMKPISPKVMYTACGSGVPEVKVILSGFVIRRFLGTYTLFCKTIALVFAIASGMALGKEGPYVHLATCVGNVLTRFFKHIDNNELLKKQILSSSASAGVALAFGSPLGGVLFILEEINNYLPSHHLFQVFFCAIISTLFLKFLNPYGTGKTVLFELEYLSDWKPIELVFFVILGILGGIFGAMFVKFARWWGSNFRNKYFKKRPLFEVFLVALVTGLVTFWNPYTKQASSELVLDLGTSCTKELDASLCPKTEAEYLNEITNLLTAFVIKVGLTFITFGIKVPCGIYVPLMVVGALFGRAFATVAQFIFFKYSGVEDFGLCLLEGQCIDFGIYAVIGAGAFMAGVTRMNITLVTILFELTSSYTYVLPISITIAVANWAGNYLEADSIYEYFLVANDYPFISPETEAIDPRVQARDVLDDSEKMSKVIKKTPAAAAIAPDPFRGISSLSQSPRLEGLGGCGVGGDPIIGNAPTEEKLYIDLSSSPYVALTTLQAKLNLLALKGLVDGCLPLLRKGVCVGLLYFSDLEICIDKLKEFVIEYQIQDELYVKLMDGSDYRTNEVELFLRHNNNVIESLTESNGELSDYFSFSTTSNGDMNELLDNLANLTNMVEKHPIFLNYDSELSLAYLIFDQIGNRAIVLLKDGLYYGVLHKKVFIDFIRRRSE